MWIVRLALRRPYTFVVAALALLLMTQQLLFIRRACINCDGERRRDSMAESDLAPL